MRGWARAIRASVEGRVAGGEDRVVGGGRDVLTGDAWCAGAGGEVCVCGVERKGREYEEKLS